jgi:hypothetical protein
MIIDVEKGLFLGLRGQGFMLGQYLAKLFVSELTGKEVPDYFSRLKLGGDALLEKAFKRLDSRDLEEGADIPFLFHAIVLSLQPL